MTQSVLPPTSLKMAKALAVCSVPLRLTRPLCDMLVSGFVHGVNPEELWNSLQRQWNLKPLNDTEWSLGEARQRFLAEFEQSEPERARTTHAWLLGAIGTKEYPADDEDDRQILEAYHTTPGNETQGATAYFRVYCGLRVRRPSGLELLARLAESQADWLPNHRSDIALYKAAALYWRQPEGSLSTGTELLILAAKSLRMAVQMDAAGLRGMYALREVSSDEGDEHSAEAYRCFQEVLVFKDQFSIDASNQDEIIERHLRLTLARAYSGMALILARRRETQLKDKRLEGTETLRADAEKLGRYALELLGIDKFEKLEESDTDEPEKAEVVTQLRRLFELTAPSSQPDEVETQTRDINLAEKIDQFERPFRERFLDDALKNTKDLRQLYYAMSVYNRGLGYLSQAIRIVIDAKGGAQLSGLFTLQTMSVLERIDTYLKTPAGGSVQYTGLEAVLPSSFRLTYEPQETSKKATLDIRIEPPLRPEQELTYRWAAQAASGTFAVSAADLDAAKIEHEYASWDILVPMKELVIEVVVPTQAGQNPPAAWFTLRNLGESALPQAQMAYEAQLESAGVRLEVRPLNVEQCQLRLEVPYPRMALRYQVAWQPS